MEDCANPLGSLDAKGSLLLFYPYYRLAIIKCSNCKENGELEIIQKLLLCFYFDHRLSLLKTDYKLVITILKMINV